MRNHSHKQGPSDLNEIAFRVMGEATSSMARVESAPIRGTAGGLAGGKARADRLTPERRSEIASRAARVRWGKEPR